MTPDCMTMAVIGPDGWVSSVIVVDHFGSQIPGLTLVPIQPDDANPPGIGWRYERGSFAPPPVADAIAGQEPEPTPDPDRESTA